MKDGGLSCSFALRSWDFVGVGSRDGGEGARWDGVSVCFPGGFALVVFAGGGASLPLPDLEAVAAALDLYLFV